MAIRKILTGIRALKRMLFGNLVGQIAKNILSRFLKKKLKKLQEKAFDKIEELNETLKDVSPEERGAAFRAWLKKELESARNSRKKFRIGGALTNVMAELFYYSWHELK